MPCMAVHAGDWEDLLFHDGLHLSPTEVGDLSPGDIQAKRNWLTQKCDFDPDQICIEWKLQVSTPSQEVEAKDMVEDALNVWLQGAQLPINFIYSGLVEEVPFELPYQKDAGGDIIYDEFGNAILEGPFIFAFDPPTGEEAPEELSFSEGELSKNLKYVQFDSEKSKLTTAWSGIFVNPAFNPLSGCENDCLETSGFLSYSLRSVLVFEIGRLLGLGPSALSQAVMYPIQLPGSVKRFDFLRDDDRNWIRKLYSLDVDGTGSLSGKMIDGLNGQAWEGANIVLLPIDSVQAFSETVDTNLFIQSALASRSGSFYFPAVPEGSYILLAEALNGVTLLPELFDDWLLAFGSSESFEPDFYDGKERESNKELLKYSPRGVWFAASVHIIEGEETSGVEIITNQFEDGVELIQAAGSTNESLSPFSPEDLSESIAKQAQSPNQGGGGCSLSQNEKHSFGMVWVLGLLMLVLVRRCQKLLGE